MFQSIISLSTGVKEYNGSCQFYKSRILRIVLNSKKYYVKEEYKEEFIGERVEPYSIYFYCNSKVNATYIDGLNIVFKVEKVNK